MTSEERRLREAEARTGHWRRWGPYLTERQWGTVREDYSRRRHGLGVLPARPRALARVPLGRGRHRRHLATTTSDSASRSRCGTARDPILKERLFGLTGNEGNHGEDVKEYYFYLDSHADALLHEVPLQVSAGGVPVRGARRGEPAARTARAPEYELLDTGVFDDDRYFDVVVEYAKAAVDDILIRISATNRGPEAAAARTCCRRSGSATPGRGTHERAAAARCGAASRRARRRRSRPSTRRSAGAGSTARATPELLFTENETNTQRLWGVPNADAVRQGRASTTTSSTARTDAVNPDAGRHEGGARAIALTIGAGRDGHGAAAPDRRAAEPRPFGRGVRRDLRRSAAREADEFYATVIPREPLRRRAGT